MSAVGPSVSNAGALACGAVLGWSAARPTRLLAAAGLALLFAGVLAAKVALFPGTVAILLGPIAVITGASLRRCLDAALAARAQTRQGGTL